jgi:phospholipid transport system substrate-binding protein
MRITAYICLLILCGVPALSFEEQSIEALKRGIEKGIRVLEDPFYKDASKKKDQEQSLWEITQEIFDFEEFSRRVLSSHWKAFTPRQSEEFVQVFGEFLRKFYLDKLQEKYRNERIVYFRQKMIGKSKALVEIKVLWRDLEVPVTVMMSNRSGTWKAYDVSALGVSAVKNYRAQFKWMLRSQSPAQVIELLKERIKKLDASKACSRRPENSPLNLKYAIF